MMIEAEFADRAAREQIAMRAAQELDALLYVLGREIGRDDSDLSMHGILMRAKCLSGVVLSVHGGDDDREMDEMREIVLGAPHSPPNA